MRRLRVPWVVITIAIAVLASTVWVTAAPVLGGRKPRLRDDIHSLVGLKTATIHQHRLPTELVEAGANSARVLGDFRQVLERESGLKIKDRDADARIELRVMAASHGGARGVVGIVAFISVFQKANVVRNDSEGLMLPTMVLSSKLSIVPVKTAATAYATQVRIVTDQFATIIARVKQIGERPIGR